MYCVHTPFSQEPTNSNTFTHSFIHSFIHSFFPSLESELTSQPQSTTIEKACKYWAKFRKRKVKMDTSTKKSRWASWARKKAPNTPKKSIGPRVCSHSSSRDDGKTDKERRTESWKRCTFEQRRERQTLHQQLKYSDANTQTQTHTSIHSKSLLNNFEKAIFIEFGLCLLWVNPRLI